MKILKFIRGEDPIFEKFEILLDNINKGLHITIETKFRASRSIIEDFEIFTPPKKEGGRTPFLKILKFYLGILIRVPI